MTRNNDSQNQPNYNPLLDDIAKRMQAKEARDSVVISALAEALLDEDNPLSETGRASAVAIIGEIGGEEAINTLAAALYAEESPIVRIAILHAFSEHLYDETAKTNVLHVAHNETDTTVKAVAAQILANDKEFENEVALQGEPAAVGVPTPALPDWALALIDRVKPLINELKLVTLNYTDYLQGTIQGANKPQPAKQRESFVCLNLAEQMLSSNNVRPLNKKMVIPLAEALGKQLLIESRETIPDENLRAKLANHLGEEVLKQKLPWATGNVKIWPNDPDELGNVNYAASADISKSTFPQPGTLRIMLVLSENPKLPLQADITAELGSKSTLFIPASPQKPGRDEDNVVQLKIQKEAKL